MGGSNEEILEQRQTERIELVTRQIQPPHHDPKKTRKVRKVSKLPLAQTFKIKKKSDKQHVGMKLLTC